MPNIFNQILQTSKGRFVLFLGVAAVVVGGVALYASFDGGYIPNGHIGVETLEVEAADSNGDVTKIERDGDTLILSIYPNDKIIVRVVKDNIIYADYQPNGNSASASEVIDPNLRWDVVGADVDIHSNPIIIKTNRMAVKINKTPFKVSAYDASGNLMIEQQDSNDPFYARLLKFKHNSNDNFYGISGYNIIDKNFNDVYVRHYVDEGILRNGGQRTTGKYVKSGKYFAGAGFQGGSGAPFIWSTKGYGILVDGGGGSFCVNKVECKDIEYIEDIEDKTRLSIDPAYIEGGNRKYYILVGSPKEILEGVAKISGKPPLFPKWALGFINVEWGLDQEELIDIVNTYRRKNIPIDVFIPDNDWKAWGEDDYGEWRWDTVGSFDSNTGITLHGFPDGPSGRLKEIMDEKGIKLVAQMKPRVHLFADKDNKIFTKQAEQITKDGCWLDNEPCNPNNPCDLNQPNGNKCPLHCEIDYMSNKLVKVFDFNKKQCREWFWQGMRSVFDTGLTNFRNDEAEANNFYNFDMQKGAYEWQRSFSNQRVFSINRSFLLGAQRFAYSLWSGDIDSTFSSLFYERPGILSNINLGLTHWSMDIGGFQGNPRINGEPSPQLYARWMQFGLFVPIMKVQAPYHVQRQPWVYSNDGVYCQSKKICDPQAEKVATDAIKLRYKLIPYMYSYERKAHETGIGLVKSLVMDYPNDPNVINYYDAWMFGDYLLVSPVVEQGQTVKSIYLPQGEWIDYFKGTKYTGGQIINYSINAATWEDIPLFIKKGAIIPTQEVLNYIGEKPITIVEVDVFPDTTSTTFKYYDDDGETYSYEQGEYFIQNMAVQDKGDEVNFVITSKEGNFTPPLQYYILKIHNTIAGSATSNGTLLTQYPDFNSLKNISNEGWAKGRDIYGDVVYAKIKAQELKNVVVDKSVLPQQYPLTVSKSGTGFGVIIAQGITCGSDCSETYNQETSVTLTAIPDSNSIFSNWSGDCSGTNNTCTLTMNSNKSVTAVFNKKPTDTVVCSTGTIRACIDSISPNPADKGQTITFNGHGENDDNKPITGYRWRLDNTSGIGTLLSKESTFSTNIIVPGTHTIYFRIKVKKIFGGWSDWVSREFTVNDEFIPPTCGNNICEPGETYSDCSLDCPTLPKPQCSDGIDNDNDNKIDFPGDPGCSSAIDNDETDAPLPSIPAAPLDLIVASGNKPSPNIRNLNLKWKDMSSNEDKFELEWRFTEGNFSSEWIKIDLPADQGFYTFRAFDIKERTYYFRVHACNIAGCSDYTENNYSF